ncbi:MAG: hypothetical protein MZV64_37015 [Ignavibacteriales bacterium]|nr:hypothetical protein [Ignavibacteriales bacterium]
MEEFRLEFQERVGEMQNGDMVEFGSWTDPDISFPKFEIVKAILIDMKELVEKMPEMLFRTGVTWLLDVAVIPMGLLFILYKLAQLFMGSVFGSTGTRSRKSLGSGRKVLKWQGFPLSSFCSRQCPRLYPRRPFTRTRPRASPKRT